MVPVTGAALWPSNPILLFCRRPNEASDDLDRERVSREEEGYDYTEPISTVLKPVSKSQQ